MTELLYTQEQLIQVRNDNYNAGVTTERERIIKLLEDECAGDWPKFIEMYLEDLIALIKGENK